MENGQKIPEVPKVIRLKLVSLDDIVLKQDDIIITASTKVGKIMLLDGAGTSSMKHYIYRKGDNVLEYEIGDEVIALDRVNLEFEWENPITKEVLLVRKTDKYSLDLVIRPNKK